MAPDIVEVKEAQAEALAPLRPRQSDQQIGDLLVLVVQLGAVTKARLADIEGAGRRVRCSPHAAPLLSWPSPGVEMAASLLSQSLLEEFGLHAHLRIHLLQPTVLVFQSFHLADHRCIHTAILGSPFVK